MPVRASWLMSVGHSRDEHHRSPPRNQNSNIGVMHGYLSGSRVNVHVSGIRNPYQAACLPMFQNRDLGHPAKERYDPVDE